VAGNRCEVGKERAAILKDVQRVKEAEQKSAFGKMHEGEFLDALKTFEKAGGLHWTTRQSDALRGMAEKYTADLAASPDKRRFMFAFTNAEVDGLNQYARMLHNIYNAGLALILAVLFAGYLGGLFGLTPMRRKFPFYPTSRGALEWTHQKQAVLICAAAGDSSL
jgi:hypothetical protein